MNCSARFFFAALVVACSWAQVRANDLAAGPMLGHIDHVEAHIWVQTRTEAGVHLRYWADDKPEAALKTKSIATSETGFYTATFAVSDLLAGTSYTYEVYINDQKVERPYPTGFTTQPLWKYRTDPPEIRIALGSCLYVNDAYFDRPGEPYGQNFDTLKQILAQKPQAMFWLGDNVYLREGDFFTRKRLAYRWAHTRAYPDLQPLLASFANYALWDDHDFGPNDGSRAFALKDVTLELFKRYWANPSVGTPETKGVFGHVSWGDLDFFMLDNRYHRAPNGLKDGNKPYWGEAQLTWLKDSLVESRAPFKFIVNGGQIINTYNVYETFHEYRKEYAELMEFLASHRVRGVVFLSGDRHHSELLRQTRPEGYPLYEFTSSPLTAGLGKVSGGIEEHNPLRVEGTLVIDKQSFGILEVTGKRRERVLTMKTYDSEGTLRWSHSLHQDDLK